MNHFLSDDAIKKMTETNRALQSLYEDMKRVSDRYEAMIKASGLHEAIRAQEEAWKRISQPMQESIRRINKWQESRSEENEKILKSLQQLKLQSMKTLPSLNMDNRLTRESKAVRPVQEEKASPLNVNINIMGDVTKENLDELLEQFRGEQITVDIKLVDEFHLDDGEDHTLH